MDATKTSTHATDEINEIIALALSDHATFEAIQHIYGLGENQVKALMRSHLKRRSYIAWRKRVRAFSDRRANYK